MWDISTGVPVTQLIAHDREVYDVAWSPAQREIFASVGADGSVRMFDLRSLEHSTILYEAAPSPASASASASASTSTTATSSSGGSGSSGNSAVAAKDRGGGGAASPSGKKGSSSSSGGGGNNKNTHGGPPAPLLRLAFSPTSPNYLAVVHADSPAVQILDTRSPGTAAFEVRGHKAPVNGIAWGGETMSAGGGGGGGAAETSGPGWLSTVCEFGRSFAQSRFHTDR